MQCKDVMTKSPKSFPASGSTQQAAQLMKQENIGILPVVDDKTQKLVGVVTDRDLCLGVVGGGKNPQQAKVSEFMSKNVLTCKPDDDLNTAEQRMKQNHVGRIPVVDQSGYCIGIISQGDIALKGGKPQEVYETFREVARRSARIIATA
jgi:CBS domain-containing protein